MDKKTLYQDLRRGVDEIPLMDSHEHLPPEPTLISGRLTFWQDLQYARQDLEIAGLPPEVVASWPDLPADGGPAPEVDDATLWSQVEPYLHFIRHTGYGEMVLRGLRLAYGIDVNSLEDVLRVNAAMREAHTTGIYDRFLRQRANIEGVINYKEYDFEAEYPPFFHKVLYVDEFARLIDTDHLRQLEARYDMAVHRLEHIGTLLERVVERGIQHGAIGLKVALAYVRPLYFPHPSRVEAEKALERLLTFTPSTYYRLGSAFDQLCTPYFVGDSRGAGTARIIPYRYPGGGS